MLHEEFLIWICCSNSSLSYLLSFRHTTINTPEHSLCSCRWKQEGKQQEMLYIEQITCSMLFILLLMSLYDIFQPFWTLWHREKRRIQIDDSFSVRRQLRCDPHVCSNSTWEQSFITGTRGKVRCDDFYYSWLQDFNSCSYVCSLRKNDPENVWLQIKQP